MKTAYKIDPAHSQAHFTIRHMMISNIRGGFGGVQGKVIYDPENPSASSVDVEIDANTLTTTDATRDQHVKGADFLDVGKYPKIIFRSKQISKEADGQLQVIGDLTIRDVTNEAILHVDGPHGEHKDPWGNMRIGASASTKIKRSAFGVTFNAPLETGGVMLGDDLKLELEVSLIKS